MVDHAFAFRSRARRGFDNVFIYESRRTILKDIDQFHNIIAFNIKVFFKFKLTFTNLTL